MSRVWYRVLINSSQLHKSGKYPLTSKEPCGKFRCKNCMGELRDDDNRPRCVRILFDNGVVEKISKGKKKRERKVAKHK